MQVHKGEIMGDRTPEQNEIARLTRVLEMHLADERLLSWVGTSRSRMARVVVAFGDGSVSLRRAIELASVRKQEIATSEHVAAPAVPDDDEEEGDEPQGVGAGAPWDEEPTNG